MKLQEELLQLSESYYNNRYKEWLETNQNVINNIKDVMYKEAKKGLFSVRIPLCLSDDDLFNLKKWISYTGLKYRITYITYFDSENTYFDSENTYSDSENTYSDSENTYSDYENCHDYDLYVTWDISKND